MLLNDLRYGIRHLYKNPGFAFVAVITLAMGTALTATMFTVIYAVLLRPLPFPNAEQLVLIGHPNASGTHPGPALLPDIRDWRAQNSSFQDIAWWELSANNLQSQGGVKSVVTIACSVNLFSVLQVEPILGRSFYPDEENPAEQGVVILSASVWKSLFSSDPGVINTRVELGGRPYMVIGVMPDGLTFPLTEDGLVVWEPVRLKKEWEDRNTARPQAITARLQVIGRLKNGISAKTAQADLALIESRALGLEGKSRLLVEDYRRSVTGDLRIVLLSLEAAVLAVWLIACINVISLLIARAVNRRHEMAIRHAMGASQWRLLRQLLAEAMTLAALAGVVGLIMAWGTIQLIRPYLEPKLPFAHTIKMDLATITAILLLSMISILLFSIWPALQAFRTSPREALTDRAAGIGTSRYQRRVRDGLVICEVALSVALLLDAGLFLRTFDNLSKTSLGFVPHNLVVVQLPLFQSRGGGGDIVQSLYNPLLHEIQNQPGVQSAAISTILPLNPTSAIKVPVQIFGREEAPDQKSKAELRLVSPELYRTLGVRLLKGRLPADTDTVSAPWAVVVNQSFVDRYLPGEDPLGKQIKTGSSGLHQLSPIIGVVENTRQKPLSDDIEPEIHISYRQLTPEDKISAVLGLIMHVAIRTQGEPAGVIPGVRKSLQKISPEGRFTITTMEAELEKSLGSRMIVARLIWVFAGAALLMSVIGLYGLLSYHVNSSVRDIAVRLALGASRSGVVMLVIRHAMLVLGIGIVIGLIIWEQTASLLQSYLYGVKQHDLLTIISVIVILSLSGLLASYIPARRASSVDPVKHLRSL
jgi:predicted permease